MSSFTAPLTVTKVWKGHWTVDREFRYYIDHEGSDNYVDVPKGFLTDFASVPRIFWSIIPPDGQYTQAAVLHDYLYNTKIKSRKESDKIFLEAMKLLGVPKLRREVMHRAVRMFGWIPWNKSLKKG